MERKVAHSLFNAINANHGCFTLERFLAFARHLGFRRALLEQGVVAHGICGTSSGSVVGALWANGYSEQQMCELLHVPRPISKMTFNLCVWRGLFRLDKLMSTLKAHLPETIEELPIPFGVGVTTPNKEAKILTSGALIPAIAASCAIPYAFQAVEVDGIPYSDGGFVDRINARLWKLHRPDKKYIAHIVDRSNGAANEVALDGVTIVRTPRSFASFLSMGDFQAQLDEAYNISRQQLTV